MKSFQCLESLLKNSNSFLCHLVDWKKKKQQLSNKYRGDPFSKVSAIWLRWDNEALPSDENSFHSSQYKHKMGQRKLQRYYINFASHTTCFLLLLFSFFFFTFFIIIIFFLFKLHGNVITVWSTCNKPSRLKKRGDWSFLLSLHFCVVVCSTAYQRAIAHKTGKPILLKRPLGNMQAKLTYLS